MILAPIVLDAPHARASLRVGVTQAAPAKPFLAAVEIATDPKWHVYWKNPGDSGIPTTVVWSAPKGWKVEPLEYPAPHRFAPGGVAAYGYEGKTLLLARVTPSSTPGALAAKVNWLVCSEACIQGGANLSKPIRIGRNTPGSDAAKLVKAQSELPKVARGWKLMARLNSKTVNLVAQATPPFSGKAEFFPLESGLVDQAKPFMATLTNGRYVFKMDVSPFPEARTRLRGLLVPVGDRRHAVTVDTTLVTGD